MTVSRASRFTGDAKTRGLHVSFEFFPPKTAEMEVALWEAIERLAPLAPNFVSVTYGAGGSTRERTHTTVKRILGETALTPAAHLTCVAATRDEIDAVIGAYAQAGVRHIVALRGDPIGGAGEEYAPHPGGYTNAADLVAGIKRISDIEVSVSAYPEKHPDSSFSRTTSTSAISSACARPEYRSRSCRESSPFRISRPRRRLRRAAAPRSRPGSPSALTASTTMP